MDFYPRVPCDLEEGALSLWAFVLTICKIGVRRPYLKKTATECLRVHVFTHIRPRVKAEPPAPPGHTWFPEAVVPAQLHPYPAVTPDVPLGGHLSLSHHMAFADTFRLRVPRVEPGQRVSEVPSLLPCSRDSCQESSGDQGLGYEGT